MGNNIVRVNGKVYENVGTLGEGGFSSVYAVQRDNNRYALKWRRGITEQEDLQRVLLEIQVQRRLQHPNILPLIEAEVRLCEEDAKTSLRSAKSQQQYGNGQYRNQLAVSDHGSLTKEALMLFPIYPRGTLQAYLDQSFRKHETPFTEDECLRIFALLLDAVQELHNSGFVHRDLKPGNVLLSSTEPMEPILMDFGSIVPINISVSTALDATALCEEAAQFSSAPYRPPELWDSGGTSFRGTLDGRTDVWALSCILYAMVFGPLSPFEHEKEGVQLLAILSGNVRFPPGPTRFGVQFSPAFTTLIKWMLTVDFSERPTLEAVRQRVQEIRSTKETTVTERKSISISKQFSTEWADFRTFEDNSAFSTTFSVSTESADTYSASRSSSLSHRKSILLATSKSMSFRERHADQTDTNGAFNNSERQRALSNIGKQLLNQGLNIAV